MSLIFARAEVPASRRGRSRPTSPMRSEYQWLEVPPRLAAVDILDVAPETQDVRMPGCQSPPGFIDILVVI